MFRMKDPALEEYKIYSNWIIEHLTHQWCTLKNTMYGHYAMYGHYISEYQQQ